MAHPATPCRPLGRRRSDKVAPLESPCRGPWSPGGRAIGRGGTSSRPACHRVDGTARFRAAAGPSSFCSCAEDAPPGSRDGASPAVRGLDWPPSTTPAISRRDPPAGNAGARSRSGGPAARFRAERDGARCRSRRREAQPLPVLGSKLRLGRRCSHRPKYPEGVTFSFRQHPSRFSEARCPGLQSRTIRKLRRAARTWARRLNHLRACKRARTGSRQRGRLRLSRRAARADPSTSASPRPSRRGLPPPRRATTAASPSSDRDRRSRRISSGERHVTTAARPERIRPVTVNIGDLLLPSALPTCRVHVPPTGRKSRICGSFEEWPREESNLRARIRSLAEIGLTTPFAPSARQYARH